MAGAHDGEVNKTATFSAVTSATATSKTTAGSDRCGIVKVAFNNETSSVSSATWNGSSMTSIATATETASASLRSTMWRIVAPATAASSVVMNFGGSSSGAYAVESYNGIHQTTPVGYSGTSNSTGSPSTITMTATTASGEMVVDSYSVTKFDGGESYTVGANQTQVGNQNYATFYFGLASYQLGADGGVMSWSVTGGAHWAGVVASLAAAAAATASRQGLLLMGCGR